MSTSPACSTCKGSGWVCGRCGKMNYRPESRSRRDFGKGCACWGRSVRCPTHAERVRRCDACRLIVSGSFSQPDPANAHLTLKSIDLCASCARQLSERVAVAIDAFFSRGAL